MQCWYSSSIAIWLITITTTIELTSQSEILIIRHGRSRSRHSAEKEHVRWGLKAFDNLTIFSEHRDSAAISSSLEGAAGAVTGEGGNIVSFYEHNGTLSPSSDFNGTIGSYEINYTFGPSRAAVAMNSNSEEHGRHHHTQSHKNLPPSTTTEMTKIPVHVIMDRVVPKKIRRNGNGRKAEIMTNIKSTVNKGIQYLKSHANLDEIEIEINDMNANRKRLTKGNKMRSTEETQQKQQHKLPKQIKMNGSKGKEFTSIVTVPMSNKSNAATAAMTPPFKSKKPASNHIKIHQAHNEIDLHIKSNLADNFYGQPNEKNHSPHAAHKQNVHAADDDGEMLSDEPAGKGNSNKMEIKESLMEKANQRKFDANQNRTVASTRNVTTDNLRKMNATHANEISNNTYINKTKNLDKSQLNANQMSDNVDSHHDLIQNDDQNGGEEIIEDISIQNDEISNENTIDLTFEGGEEEELDENSGNFNGIYQLEDFDLSNLDETSQNNRKNLMRGRDVVTRFLQIVESQHMLGNNCTAGTALNLGEGVVDRYAQDRFRVEAEVAVNRANMLTRQVHLF